MPCAPCCEKKRGVEAATGCCPGKNHKLPVNQTSGFCAGPLHVWLAPVDRYGLEVCKNDAAMHRRVSFQKGRGAGQLYRMPVAWGEGTAKRKARENTQEDYDRWRYHYPEFDTTQRWAKVPSQALSDDLVEALRK